MKIKTRAKTIDIKFENRQESIAFMRQFGFVHMVVALQEAEDRERAKLGASSAGHGKGTRIHL